MNPDKWETPAGRELRLFLEAQGEKRGRQEALLTLLRARGLPSSPKEEARIRACTDTTELDQWITRAATASSVREVLGVKPSAPAARRRPARRARAASTSRG
jgi:hypothetical protein